MFKEIPASKRSLSMRRLIYGAGINDADYQIQIAVNGKKIGCPYYFRWVAMLARCYSSRLKDKYPTYNGCTASVDWLLFSNFKAWMSSQDWVGKHLDKDLLIQGNKVYSSKTCIFVSSQINGLLCDSKAIRGKYPQGVTFDVNVQKIKAQVKVNGKLKGLGYFETATDAHIAYKTAKYAIIKKIALEQAEPLRSALLNYKIKP